MINTIYSFIMLQCIKISSLIRLKTLRMVLRTCIVCLICEIFVPNFKSIRPVNLKQINCDWRTDRLTSNIIKVPLFGFDVWNPKTIQIFKKSSNNKTLFKEV